MPKTPTDLQGCYDLGYANPAMPSREFEWLHLTNVNAFAAGQADYQNQAPRNQQYSADQYDHDTFERINHAVQYDSEQIGERSITMLNQDFRLEDWPAIAPYSVRKRRAVRRVFYILCGLAIVAGTLLALNH